MCSHIRVLAWGGVAIALFGLLWPAMWVQPLDTLRSLGEWTLFGGSKVAQHILPLQDQGEGLDLAAQFTNTLPGAQYSGAWMLLRSALTFQEKYVFSLGWPGQGEL